MKTKLENESLTIYLDGRIDSSNSLKIASDIEDVLNKVKFKELILDGKNLEYLSSAGLRIILSLKNTYRDVKFIKANQNVYEIMDMTGFTEMMEVDRVYHKLSVEGCEIIGKGAKGTVYRYDPETVVKVYNNPDSLNVIKRERILAKKAFVLGIPTAISYDIARVDGKFGSVFELINAKSFSQLIGEKPEDIGFYVDEYTKLLKKIHSTVVEPDSMPDYKDTAYVWIDTAQKVLPVEIYEKIRSMIQALPDNNTMLHCDYHTNNLMQMNGETLILDMDTLSHGHPIFDLANIFTAHVAFGEITPEVVENYLGYSYKTSVDFWNRFLPKYLNTTDSHRIKDVESKTELLSYVRVLRHMVRRNEQETKEGQKKLNYYIDKVTKLTIELDSLDF